MLRQIRRFFHDRDFCEVQPPCLSRDCVVDAYLDPIRIPTEELGLPPETISPGMAMSERRSFFLQTSPESAMKRMLVDGAPSLFAIGPVFRKAEMGKQHNIEFTMLEWYERGGNAESAIALLGTLAKTIFATQNYESISYQDAFINTLNLDPITCTTEALTQHVGRVDSELAKSLNRDRDGLLDVLLTTHIEPNLGREVPNILTRYPISQAALAKPCSDDPRLAERFELFFKGIELANGYDELLNADELVRRYDANNVIRRQSGRAPLPTKTTLLKAMQKGLPACSGVALGIDRMLMLKVGAMHINEVIPFTTDIA